MVEWRREKEPTQIERAQRANYYRRGGCLVNERPLRENNFLGLFYSSPLEWSAVKMECETKLLIHNTKAAIIKTMGVLLFFLFRFAYSQLKYYFPSISFYISCELKIILKNNRNSYLTVSHIKIYIFTPLITD
jgi:hypothetical protein